MILFIEHRQIEGTFWSRITDQWRIISSKLKTKFPNLEVYFIDWKEDLTNYPIPDIFFNVCIWHKEYILKNRKKIKCIITFSGNSHPQHIAKMINPEIALFQKNPEAFYNLYIDKNTYSKPMTNDIQFQTILNISDYIILPGEFTKETFIKNGIKESKIIPLVYSVEPERFKRKFPRDPNFTIFFAGGDRLRKGERITIQAINELRKEIPNFIYLDTGHGPKIYDTVYGKSSIAFLPSLEDGLPVTLLECMSYEVPFITSFNMSFSEFFDLDENNFAYIKGTNYKKLCGKFIDVNNKDTIHEETKKAINFFYQNKDKLDEYGKNCREVILKQITWEKYRDKLYTFLKQRIEEIENNGNFSN